MKNSPLLTIAIPTYNGSKTIKNLFDLLLPQCTDEIEVIVSDNCSTDMTNKIVEEYCYQYKFIKSIRNKSNIGPDANFLQCMQLATGRFTWLISDDDVVIENAISKVLEFLYRYSDIALLYVTTIDFRGEYKGVKNCSFHKPILKETLCTQDKKQFIKYAGPYWGFMSSFICNTEKFKKIKQPDKFFGTFWLQSYIHSLCAAEGNARLGLIKEPCIGAGIYVNTANFDSALVNGVYYKKMLSFMATYSGFDKNQLNKLYIWRICHLSRHDIIKEKASKKRKIDRKLLVKCTFKYPIAWITVYPLFVLPNVFCRFALEQYRASKGIAGKIKINRPE